MSLSRSFVSYTVAYLLRIKELCCVLRFSYEKALERSGVVNGDLFTLQPRSSSKMAAVYFSLLLVLAVAMSSAMPSYSRVERSPKKNAGPTKPVVEVRQVMETVEPAEVDGDEGRKTPDAEESGADEMTEAVPKERGKNDAVENSTKASDVESKKKEDKVKVKRRRSFYKHIMRCLFGDYSYCHHNHHRHYSHDDYEYDDWDDWDDGSWGLAKEVVARQLPNRSGKAALKVKKAIDDEKKSLDDELSAIDGEKRAVDDEKRAMAEEKLALDDEKKGIDDEKRQLDDEKRLLDDEKRQLDDEKQQLDDELNTTAVGGSIV